MDTVRALSAVVTANPFDEVVKQALADAIGDETGSPEEGQKQALRVALESRIAAFVTHADEVTRRYWEEQSYTYAPPPTHRADYISEKWCRVVTIEHAHEGKSRDGSVYAFVCLQDGFTKALGKLKAGDIHKADGFKRAAKHARGSVFAADFGNCAGPHGISYLR